MTRVHKNLKIYVNIHYFTNHGYNFLPIKLICLTKNFKIIAQQPFELELVKIRKK